MIKVLITNFFNEIEKRELKKTKHAKATFWVEELQQVDYTDKNYIGVKKATRLYERYIEGKENISVKEPDKFLCDFMSQYLKYGNFESYRLAKNPLEEEGKGKSIIEKYKYHIIGISIGLILPVLFFINKYNTNTSETCIIWTENHFEKSSCKKENTIDNTIYNIDIKDFKKVEVTKGTVFFKDGNPLIWYGKSSQRKMEFFTNRGIHPETLKELKPITETIINNYVISNKEDKTITN